MVSFQPVLHVLGFDRPAILSALLLLSVWPARKFGTATTRALAMALAFMLLSHLAAWWAYGTASPIHALCGLLGLAIVVPIALRSRRTYPLVVAGGAMLSAVAYGLSSFLQADQATAAQCIAAVANAVVALSFWVGLARDRNRTSYQGRSYRSQERNI